MKKLAVITRDCAGVNAAIRSVVRAATVAGLEVMGVMRGYDGLMEDELIALDRKAVAGIISRGGTILKTARAQRFRTAEGQAMALETIRRHAIDGVIVIGGNGSLAGAHVLAGLGVPTVGVPATIDNDVCGVDMTIGTDTAINVAMDAVDKIRDTVNSLQRIFVVEIMGRECGYLAIQVAVAGGCEEVIIPERENNIDDICAEIKAGETRGKASWIVVVAEGTGKAGDVAKDITEKTGYETRAAVLGHIQRGGSPTAFDRILAGRLGAFAVEMIMKGKSDICVGRRGDGMFTLPLTEAIKGRTFDAEGAYRLMKLLS